MAGRRVKITSRVDEALWAWARKRAVDLHASAGELVELGLEIVKLIDEGKVPPPEDIRAHLHPDRRRLLEQLLKA